MLLKRFAPPKTGLLRCGACRRIDRCRPGSAWAQSQSPGASCPGRATRNPPRPEPSRPPNRSRRQRRRRSPSRPSRHRSRTTRRGPPSDPVVAIGRRAHDLPQRRWPGGAAASRRACAACRSRRCYPVLLDRMHRSPGVGDDGAPRAPGRRPGASSARSRPRRTASWRARCSAARSRRRSARSRSRPATTSNTPASRRPRRRTPGTSWFPPRRRRSS